MSIILIRCIIEKSRRSLQQNIIMMGTRHEYDGEPSQYFYDIGHQ